MNPLYQKDNSCPSLWLSIGGGLLIILGLGLFLTNPSQKSYEDFGTEQLVNYAREKLCQAQSAKLEEAIKSQMCTLMLETGKHQIPKIIRDTTSRHNYFFFSFYETNVYVYKFETIGIFNHFQVISVDKLYDPE